MQEIRREDLIELFKALPKESFELLLRNVSVRERLWDLWKEYESGKELGYGERFEALFEEVFRFFFRPLEITLRGVRQLRPLLPLPDLLESLEKQWNLFQAWQDFTDSLMSHFSLITELSLGITTPPVMKSMIDGFRQGWQERLERYHKHYYLLDLEDLKTLTDYPLILTKKTNEYFLSALDEWEEFSGYYMEFKDMVRDTYKAAIKEFIELANKRRLKDYREFRDTFIDLSNKKFDTLLRSKRYLEVQGNMVVHLMNYLYRTRRFFEEMFENNPVNPFATVGHVDEAHKRIMFLRRKLTDLEKRINALEKEKEEMQHLQVKDKEKKMAQKKGGKK